jgi:thiosulfate dehydrogenase [quinone] large subunit
MNSQMTAAADTRAAFGLKLLRERPLKGIGIGFVLLLRILFGIFFAGGAANKFMRDYLFGDYPLDLFTKRLAELDPASFPARYLESFIIPNYHFVGWVVAWGEVAVAVGMLLGLMTRSAGLVAVFLMVNFGLGGYYDASLIPLNLIALLFVVLPTGHWLGLDRRLNQRYPQSIWFK